MMDEMMRQLTRAEIMRLNPETQEAIARHKQLKNETSVTALDVLRAERARMRRARRAIGRLTDIGTVVTEERGNVLPASEAAAIARRTRT